MKTVLFLLSLLLPTILFPQFIFHNPDETSNRLIQLEKVENTLVVLSRGENRILEFDGNSWTSYNSSDFAFGSMFSDAKEFYVDNQGQYWLVYSKDVDFFDGEEVQLLSQSNFGFINDFVLDVIQDKNGNYFFSHGNGNGISMLSDDEWTHKGEYTDNLEILNTISQSSFMAYDEVNDCIWIYSAGRFLQYKEDSIIEFPEADLNINFDLSVNYCRDMTVTPDGKVWFAISDGSESEGGILTFSDGVWTFINQETGLPAKHVVGIASLGNDVYIADASSGQVSKLEDNQWTTYSNLNSNWPEYYFSTMYEMIEVNSDIFIASNNGVIQLINPSLSTKNSKIQSIKIFPNPTYSSINIQSNNISKISRLSVYNSLGKETLRYIEHIPQEVNLDAYSGLYYFQFEFKDGSFESYPVLKQ